MKLFNAFNKKKSQVGKFFSRNKRKEKSNKNFKNTTTKKMVVIPVLNEHHNKLFVSTYQRLIQLKVVKNNLEMKQMKQMLRLLRKMRCKPTKPKGDLDKKSGLPIPFRAIDKVKIQEKEDASKRTIKSCQNSFTSLEDIVMNCSLRYSVLPDILSQVAKELSIIHGNQETHGNLKPSNIFISEDLKGVKLSESGSRRRHYQSSTESVMQHGPKQSAESFNIKKQKDIIDLGFVFFFVLSHGHNVPVHRRDKDGQTKNWDEEELGRHIYVDKIAALDLIGKMLRSISDPLTAEEILIHPFFWSSDFKLQFYQQILRLSNAEKPFMDELNELEIVGSWEEKMMLTDLERCQDPILFGEKHVIKLHEKRSETVCGLLKIIADVILSLENEDDPTMHALFSTSTDIWDFFDSRFPMLLMHIHSVLSAWLKKTGEKELHKYMFYKNDQEHLYRQSSSDFFKNMKRSNDKKESKPIQQSSCLDEPGPLMSHNYTTELSRTTINVPQGGTNVTIQNNHIVFPEKAQCTTQIILGIPNDTPEEYQPISSLFELRLASSMRNLPKITAKIACYYADYDFDFVPEIKILVRRKDKWDVHGCIELPDDREEVEFDWPGINLIMAVLAIEKKDVQKCIFIVGGKFLRNANEFMALLYLEKANGQINCGEEWSKILNFGSLSLKYGDEITLKLYGKGGKNCAQWIVKFDDSFLSNVTSEKKFNITDLNLGTLELQLEITINSESNRVRFYSFVLE